MSGRRWLGLGLAALAACAGTRSAPGERHAGTLAGFRDASPLVAELLDGALAWAVFPTVEDGASSCRHVGRLHHRDGRTEPVVLRCAERPGSPGGVAYHELVILRSAADLEALDAGGLDLGAAPHLPYAAEGASPEGSPVVVTTPRATLLFGDHAPAQVLERDSGR